MREIGNSDHIEGAEDGRLQLHKDIDVSCCLDDIHDRGNICLEMRKEAAVSKA